MANRGFGSETVRLQFANGEELKKLLDAVVPGAVFAGFHFEPTRFFVLLPTGLVLGWVRWKTGSTGASMVAHGLVNAPGALLLLVGVPGVTT